MPEILKALANTQRLVGARADKLKESLGIKEPEVPSAETPIKTVPDDIKTFRLDDEGLKAREVLIQKQLKTEYPALPDDHKNARIS